MDLAFDDIYLGLNSGWGHFLNILRGPMRQSPVTINWKFLQISRSGHQAARKGRIPTTVAAYIKICL
jgi:hypothetical protein